MSATFQVHSHDKNSDITYGFKSPNSSGSMVDQQNGDAEDAARNDILDKLQHELEMTRKEWLAEQQRVSELEEQLIAISKSKIIRSRRRKCIQQL